jgi:NAD(P)-dependent dehydrogenase (short-subunit alcohol dehydrogenase family)
MKPRTLPAWAFMVRQAHHEGRGARHFSQGIAQARAAFAAAVPFGRPEEIAAAAVFLAPDEASFIAGMGLPADDDITAI